jgi:hypothetical protein
MRQGAGSTCGSTAGSVPVAPATMVGAPQDTAAIVSKALTSNRIDHPIAFGSPDI